MEAKMAWTKERREKFQATIARKKKNKTPRRKWRIRPLEDLGKVVKTDTKVDKEKQELSDLLNYLKSKYLTPYGWSCSLAICDVVLSVFTDLTDTEGR